MEPWTPERLGTHVRHKKGFAFKSESLQPSGYPIVKVSNFTDGSISTEVLEYVDEQTYHENIEYRLKSGDVVIQTVGSWPNNPNSVVGRVVRVPKNLDGALLNQNAVIVYPDSKIDSSFLYYLLRSQNFKGYIVNTAQGAANQASITLDSIFRFEFYLPPKHEQSNIAVILSNYDELIENNRRRIVLLEKLAEEIYREWFVRLRFPNHDNVEFVKGLPATWITVRLGEIATFTMGQSPPSTTYNESGDGLPFHQGVGTYGDRFPRKITFCTANGRKARKGEILFSVRAPVGRLNIADDEMIIGRGLAAIRQKQGYNSYLYYLLKLAFANEDIIGNGSIFNSVGKDELARFQILQPDEALVKAFEAHVAPIDEQIAILSRSVEYLTKTRDLLVPRLISGKLSLGHL